MADPGRYPDPAGPPPGTPWEPPPEARASMATPRKVLLGALVLFVATRLLITGADEGLDAVLVVLGVAAVVLAVLFAVWLPRRRRLQGVLSERAERSGALDGALWSGIVQRTPDAGRSTNPLLAFRPSFYREFATGLLVVRPGSVGFLPGDRASANGHQPWQLPAAGLDTEVARIGASTHVYLRVPGASIELQLQFGAKGLREALTQAGAAVH